MTVRYILADDPGLATGLAFFKWDTDEEPELVWSREVDYIGYISSIREAFEFAGDSLEVVCERFTVTTDTAKKSPAPYSLELIGMLKLIMYDNGRDPDKLRLQLPADAKKMYPNPQLKKLGYWHVGGEGHALDAIRHGLLYLTKTGWKPRKLLD